jgi:hypothetical protein
MYLELCFTWTVGLALSLLEQTAEDSKTSQNAIKMGFRESDVHNLTFASDKTTRLF